MTPLMAPPGSQTNHALPWNAIAGTIIPLLQRLWRIEMSRCGGTTSVVAATGI